MCNNKMQSWLLGRLVLRLLAQVALVKILVQEPYRILELGIARVEAPLLFGCVGLEVFLAVGQAYLVLVLHLAILTSICSQLLTNYWLCLSRVPST